MWRWILTFSSEGHSYICSFPFNNSYVVVIIKSLTGGGITGRSGKTDLKGWCHVLPHISFQLTLEVDVPAGITWPVPTVIYSINGIDEVPKFDIKLKVNAAACTPGTFSWWVSPVP